MHGKCRLGIAGRYSNKLQEREIVFKHVLRPDAAVVFSEKIEQVGKHIYADEGFGFTGDPQQTGEP